VGPDFWEFWGFATHEHVLTRTVRDTAAVLDATAGMSPGDPYVAPPPARPFQAEVGVDPGRLRIGFRTRRRNRDEDAHPDCVAAVETAAKLLESLGHDVEPVEMPELDHPGITAVMRGTFGAFIARDIERWEELLGRPIDASELEPGNSHSVAATRQRPRTATEYLSALEQANHYCRQFAQWWRSLPDDDGFDVLVTPVIAVPPPRLGECAPNAPRAVLAEFSDAFAGFSLPFNLSGQPAISLPLSWNAEGLPIGVQFGAAYGREDLLLRLASQLELAQPWSNRRPPFPQGQK
jgi:amidase